ncbi:unnamed protein product [Calypogeia fissa]
MSNSEIEKKWLQALFDADCPEIQKLLEEHSWLLKVGWDQFSSLTEVVDDKGVSGKWQGSTALLEAAYTGSIDLVRQVLRVCNVAITSSDSTVDEEGVPRSSTTTLQMKTNPDEDRIPTTKDLVIADDAVQVDKSISGQRAGAAPEKRSTNAGLMKAVQTGRDNWNRLASFKPKLGTKESIQERTDEVNDGANVKKNSRDLKMSRKDLRKLLLVKSSYYCDANAMTIAKVSGYDEILDLLVQALAECDNPPFGIKKTTPEPQPLIPAVGDTKHLASLRRLTKAVLEGFHDQSSVEECRKQYAILRPYTYLPIEEYLFHFLCESNDNESIRNDYESIRKDLWSKIRSRGELWSFVLTMKDSQGRTPFHVAMESEVESFLSLLKDVDRSDEDQRKIIIFAMKTPDGAGRTTAHRAAAGGYTAALESLLQYADHDEEIAKTCTAVWQLKVPLSVPSGNPIPIDLNLLSHNNKFGLHHSPYSPVHAALITKDFECAELLLTKFPKNDWAAMTYSYTSSSLPDTVVELDTMELACLMGADASIIELLLDGYLATSKQVSPTYQFSKILSGSRSPGDHIQKGTKFLKHPWHALHLVAASGSLEKLKVFLKDRRCTATIKDFEGNTPLHHALNMIDFGFQPHLVDPVDWSDFQSFYEARDPEEESLDGEAIKDREGCIAELFGAGCGIFQENHQKKVPYPGGKLTSNEEFKSWWSEKQSKDLGKTQKQCINAANAIAVTAALVATTSYVGPLQPPLSYGIDGIHEENVWVVTFMVCDTISFYLAIAAITLSLIPSLPMPQQAIKEKPYTAQDMVTLALTLLFPSIVFVFVAFASSSIAVVSVSVTTSASGKLVSQVIAMHSVFWEFWENTSVSMHSTSVCTGLLILGMLCSIQVGSRAALLL